jgi:hypothetical protein
VEELPNTGRIGIVKPLLFLLLFAAPAFADSHLLVVDTAQYQMSFYVNGKLVRSVEIGLGQGQGAKEKQGDLKTPHGTYFVVDKQRGDFGGGYGAYFGGHWIKINYPGPDDAKRGVERGWIDAATAARITEAWRAKKLTPQNTPLGGGIGLHGWAGDWSGPAAHLSWGCVVLHTPDIAQLFDQIPLGTKVLIGDRQPPEIVNKSK